MSDGADSAAVLTVALEAARRAGAIIKEGITRPLEIAYKGHGAAANDPVTDIDRRSEAAIAETIATRFPHHRLLSEEGTTGGGDAHWRWIVDPLDGTVNYTHRLPLFCVSIGVEHDGDLVVGVVYNPVADELFVAERGHGATLNGQPIQVSATSELRRALLTAASGPWEANGRRFDRPRTLAPYVQGIRDLGSAALELCFVAAGRTDGMGGASLNAWDVAAGMLIVREAGGQVTDANGDPLGVEGRHTVASNGRLHGAILARLHDGGAVSPPPSAVPAAPAPSAPVPAPSAPPLAAAPTPGTPPPAVASDAAPVSQSPAAEAATANPAAS